MKISLTKILSEVIQNIEKDVINSHPKSDSVKRFKEITEKLMGQLGNSKIIEKKSHFNVDSGNSMYKPSVVGSSDMEHHIGEYNGSDFKNFSTKLAEMYEKAGFQIEIGYGIDDIKGFEIKESDGEVVGEVDFLKEGSIPKYGNTVIIKCKK